MRLKNKNCIITGASRGIGKAIALGFAEQGANVIVVYRSNEQQALSVVDDIKKHNQQAIAIKADVSNLDDINNLVVSAKEFFGDIHVLVNNAGIGSRSPFTEVDEQQFDKSIDINLKGPFFLTQAVAKHMISQKQGGSIINISSISAYMPELNISAYECAKAGISMFTKSAALALAEHAIRVNTLSPGLTATDMTQPKDDPYARPLSVRAEPIPLGRVGQPKDHVGAAIFLASDESSWVTGADFVVDGGEAMR